MSFRAIPLEGYACWESSSLFLSCPSMFPPLSGCRLQSTFYHGYSFLGSGELQSRGDTRLSEPTEPSPKPAQGPCETPQTLQSHSPQPAQPHHYLGMGSLQSPLLFAFFALENSFTQMLPNKPKLTCSHLSAPSAGVSPHKRSKPWSPLGATSSRD